jgi:DHA1 family tetracycline resistance protein-like MFS transporter
MRPATFIFVTVVIDVLAMGIVIPVLPKLVETFEGGNTAAAAETFGIFGTAWGLMQFIFMPVVGALSDRFGHRPVILISCFGLGLDFFLMALAPTLGWLLVGRIVSGITASSFGTAFAYIADVTPPEKRAAGFGMVGAAFGLGFVIGPAMGGVLGGIDPRLPFWVAGVLALANAAYGFFVLPESLPPEKRAPIVEGQPHGLARVVALASRTFGAGRHLLPYAVVARRASQRRRALHGISLRVERDAGGARAGRRGRVLDDRAGAVGQAGGREVG